MTPMLVAVYSILVNQHLALESIVDPENPTIKQMNSSPNPLDHLSI